MIRCLPTGRQLNAEAMVPQSPIRAKGCRATSSLGPKSERCGNMACEREERRKLCR